MKVSRMQLRSLIRDVIAEGKGEGSNLNKKDVFNAVAAGPLYALLRKRKRRIDAGEISSFKYEEGMGKDIAMIFAGAGVFTASIMGAGDLASYNYYKNKINPSDFTGQSIVVDADTESESDNVMETLDDMGIDYQIAADGLNVVVLDGEQLYTAMLGDYKPYHNLELDVGAMDYHEDHIRNPYKDFDKDDPMGTYDLSDQFTGMGDPQFKYRPEYEKVSFDEEMGEDPSGDYHVGGSRARKKRRRSGR